MKTIYRASAIFLLMLGLAGYARADSNAIKKSFEKAMPGTTIDSITESPLPGIYEVVIGPTLFYTSADGRYLINGNLYDLEAPLDGRDLTEPKISAARANAIRKISNDESIVFKSPIERQVVSVFTDVDCGYCRKLHSEIDTYLARGITIRYLFYPRAGVNSDSYKKAVAVWCADDRQEALTRVKKGESIEMKTCDNPLNKHIELANLLRIRGTPMIVTQTGAVMPGYVSADDLSRAIGVASK